MPSNSPTFPSLFPELCTFLFCGLRIKCRSPGRFLAVIEITLVLAYVLLHFDVETKDDKNLAIDKQIIPDPRAQLDRRHECSMESLPAR